MRRRLVRALAVVTAMLVSLTMLTILGPARAGSPTDRAPRMHVGGIGLSGDPGGAGPIEVPRLVRPGSDARPGSGVGAPGSVPRAPRGILAPTVVVPPFDGVPDTEEVSPGDPIGALGVQYHLAAVNVRMAFYDRAGVALDPPRLLESLDPALPGSARSFDPKVVYDPYRQHFLLAFLSATDTRSFLTVVVIPEGSEDSTSGWCTLHLSGDQLAGNGKQFADYPMMGFTRDRVTITTNQFDFSRAPVIGAFQYAQVLSIRKSQLYDCSVPVVPIKVFGGNQTRDPDGSRAFTIVPTVAFGGSPSVQYLSSLDFNGSTGKLILWRLKVVSGRLRLTRAHIAGGPMTYPRWGRQCGNTPGLNSKWDTGDLRLTSAFWDGERGRLFTATARDGNVGGGATESVIRWWEVRPTARLADADVTRTGTIGAVARDLAWPSIATDAAGKVWVNYARAGSGECLAAYSGVIQPGARGAASIRIQAGSGRYEYGPSVERWGDYTGIARDPVTPNQMATYGAYPIDDGVGGTPTRIWQQVIASVSDA